MKKKSAIKAKAGTTISGCSVDVHAPAFNDNQLMAVRAIANAVEANAKALEQAAKSLHGANINLESAFKIVQGNE